MASIFRNVEGAVMSRLENAVRVGHIDLSFHDAAAREVEAIIARHGHSIERSAAPHEEMYRRLGAGEIDLLVAAWLPASHGTYLTPMFDAVEKVTVLYEPYCIWGVPEHVPVSAIASIDDLTSPLALDRMDRLIQGVNVGAGISRFSQAIVERYGLAAHGYRFAPGSEDDCFGRFERAVAEGAWMIVPLWHPQWLHHRYRIRPLEDPKGLLGGVDNATLIVRKDAKQRLGEGTLAELSALYLGNARVGALDDALRTYRTPTTESSGDRS
ncbi:glycine betaine ABC transporter substrate-binding protein [Sphingomonas sp. RB3P16]|uniref:glycine betaine ABC transporter substrate-binding protein n=1 Tax=Parasphingomonas frigoris TaxID=3096163 RepID=UPI002FC6622C